MQPSPLARADRAFASSLKVPQALLGLRDQLSGQSPMRDLAINRSIVVLTVASWQGWVETLVGESLGHLSTAFESGSDLESLAPSVGPLIELAEVELRRFSTPDAAGVRRLLMLVSDDPLPRWCFEAAGGSRSPDDVVGRLNDWMRVRHAIAHGAKHLPPVGVLGRTGAGCGSLAHRHAARCIAFYELLVHATGVRAIAAGDAGR